MTECLVELLHRSITASSSLEVTLKIEVTEGGDIDYISCENKQSNDYNLHKTCLSRKVSTVNLIDDIPRSLTVNQIDFCDFMDKILALA